MKTYYQMNGLLKFTEEDSYENGCNPDTVQIFEVDKKFEADTPQELIKDVAEWLAVDNDGIEKNACDEAGRVDFSLMEDGESNKSTKTQISAWKKNKQKLWSVTYTGYVEKVEFVRL